VAREKDRMFDSARTFSRHFEVFFFIKGNPLVPTSATPDRLLANLEIDRASLRAAPDGALDQTLRVTATNTGNSLWLSDTRGEKGQVNLGMHLFTSTGELVNLDYFRATLPRDVAPSESVTLEVSVLPRLKPGNYELEIDLVDEGFCWFKQWGTAARRAQLTVQDSGATP
jgi:hypothetical protein